MTVKNPPHYIFCIEPVDKNSVIPADFAQILDNEIRKDIGYGNKRRDNLLADPGLLVMKHGWLDEIYKERISAGCLSITQIKLSVIYKKIPCANFKT